MIRPLLHTALRRAACLFALVALAGPTSAQTSNNLNILSNYGRGDGETRSLFALGTRAYYGIGNRLEISDFSTPTAPVALGSANLPDRVEDVIVVGSTVYVSSIDGVHIFNAQNPTQIRDLGSVKADNYGEGIAVSPPYILFADGSAGLRILNATNPASPTQVAKLDTLGYVESVSYSGNLAFVSAGSRIHIIDFSNPASPTYVARIGAPLDYYQSTVVRGSFLYVADFFGGFRVFNISNPASPVDVGFFDPADRTARIALDGNFAYVANGDKGVTILNIANPAAPTQVAVIDTPGRALQVRVSGTLAYIADTQGLQVFDVSTPASPVFRSKIDAQPAAAGKAFGINIQGDYAYVAYGDAGLRILNASNPAGGLPQVAQLDVKNAASEGQARQVAVSGNYAYVASRAAGVRVVDITNPTSPAIVATLAVADAGDVALDGTTLAVAGADGITLFSLATPAAPTQIFASSGIGYADRVGVSGSYAYAITEGSNVRVFDIANPAAVALVGTVATGGDYSEGRLTVQGNRLYTTNGDFLAIDITNKATPILLGTYDAPSYSYSVGVLGNYAYVATERQGIRLVDISNPASPAEVGFAKPGGEMRDVAFRGGLVFTANGNSGVTVLQNTLVTAGEASPSASRGVTLFQNAPNPAGSVTSLRFELAAAGDVSIEVINVLGQRVATVLNEPRSAGSHTVAFDASRLPAGTYVVQVRAAGEQVSRRMTVVR